MLMPIPLQPTHATREAVSIVVGLVKNIQLNSRTSSRFEAYDRVEGQAQIAERTAQIQNKDDLTKGEKKEIDNEKQHQLQMRHRGVMQYQAARTSKWSKEGLKRRVGALKDKITGNSDKDNHRGQVETEA